MLSGMKAMTGPDLLTQKSIFINKKHYYVPFYFANENILMQRIEQKWIEN